MVDITNDPSLPLKNNIAIVDEEGIPTPEFLRKWERFINKVGTVTQQATQQQTNLAQRIIRNEGDVPYAIIAGRVSSRS